MADMVYGFHFPAIIWYLRFCILFLKFTQYRIFIMVMYFEMDYKIWFFPELSQLRVVDVD